MAYYIIFDKGPAGSGYCVGFSSMQGVADYTQIPYDDLTYQFTRKKKRWHRFEGKAVDIIKVDYITKGKQRFTGKTGKGFSHDRNI